MSKETAIYVHWPWCKKKCPYCDFNSHVSENIPEDAYLNALINDLKRHRELTGPRKIVSVFFGGGTPSLMPIKHFDTVLQEINALYGLNNAAEVTVECNPTSSSKNMFKNLKNVGVNRFSIGVQSFRDEHLITLGREHNAKEALNTVHHAREVCDNVSMDIIYGIPNQTLESWQKDLETAKKFDLDHLSAYQLTIEQNTIFYAKYVKGFFKPISDDYMYEFFELTKEFLHNHNYNNYEISNFCRNNRVSIHNSHVWRQGDYIGIGAGAHGRLTLLNETYISTQHRRMPDHYIADNSCSHVDKSIPKTEIINKIQQLNERLIMGLRLKDGISIPNEYDIYINKSVVNKFEQLLMLDYYQKKIVLKNAGWPFLDTILSELLVDNVPN